MAESIVSDWLAEYERIEDSPTEVQTFIAEHENNHEVSSAIFSIINERLKYPDVSKANTCIDVHRCPLMQFNTSNEWSERFKMLSNAILTIFHCHFHFSFSFAGIAFDMQSAV